MQGQRQSVDGVSHAVEVQGTSLFEVAQSHDEGWSVPLPPDGVLRVEGQIPPIVHEVPLKALQRWANGPSLSPKDKLLQRPIRTR